MTLQRKELTLFYDSYCPLCMAEMRHLKRKDTLQKLAFVDINNRHFSRDYPHISKDALNARIHGQIQNGDMLTGLDVTHKAWSLVGYAWLYAPLRWPLIKPLADRLYLWFARNRYTISYWITGKKRCEGTACSLDDRETL